MDFANPVTAISASLYPDNRAFIATEDGTLHVWDVDGLQTGTGTGTNASEVCTLSIGRNVTRIAHMKHWLPNDDCERPGAEPIHPVVARGQDGHLDRHVEGASHGRAYALRLPAG